MRKFILGLAIVIFVICAAYFFLFSRQQDISPERKPVATSHIGGNTLSEEETGVSQAIENTGMPDELNDTRMKEIIARAERLYMREQKLGVIVKPEHPVMFDLKAHIPPDLQKNQ